MVRAAFNALASLLLLISGESFANAQERTTVMLVRHAQRESLATPDPPLTAAVRERALALRAALRGYRGDHHYAILSHASHSGTPERRTWYHKRSSRTRAPA